MKIRHSRQKRGDIYDRNGNILATSNKVYNVILDCLEVNKDQDSVEPTIKALVEVLGLDEDEMRKLLTDSGTKESQYQIVKKQISMDDKKPSKNTKIRETTVN